MYKESVSIIKSFFSGERSLARFLTITKVLLKFIFM